MFSIVPYASAYHPGVRLSGRAMLPISKRYTHFVFAILQSGLTTAIAAAIATLRASDATLGHWFASWIISWLIMTPIVAFAAPSLRALSEFLTRDPTPDRL